MDLTRRELGLAALPGTATAQDGFSFVHFTDLHIQPELSAAEGCRRCVERINALKPAFAISGGDLVFDACEVPYARAEKVFDLYAETVKPLRMPVYSAIGNHDLFGVSSKSGIAPNAPHFGKQIFEERIGKRYSAFRYRGWHFVLLDSIGSKGGRDFVGHVDAEQLEWLKGELRGTRGKLIVVTHVPLVSGVMQVVEDPWKSSETYLVTNAREVLEILWPHEPVAVLQGHTHIRETLHYRGCQFITSGAVCGNWWKGPRESHPEGFGVLTVQGGNLTWRYETFGFRAG